jgi:hypothetical protein
MKEEKVMQMGVLRWPGMNWPDYWPMGQRWEGNMGGKWVGTPAKGFCTI